MARKAKPPPGEIVQPPPREIIKPPDDLQPVPKVINLSAVRAADMVALDFRCINLKVQGNPPVLVRTTPGNPAYLAVRFPIQAIAEEAYRLGSTSATSDTPPAPPVPSRAAEPSWLVFQVPASVTAIPYTLEGLLDWLKLQPVTVSTAKDPTDNGRSDTPFTAIEAPYRLFLSPSAGTAWAQATTPVEHDGRVELWHTRLVPQSAVQHGQVQGEPATEPTVRAIWSPDMGILLPADSANPINHKPFTRKAALPRRIRRDLVILTARNPASPPIHARRLMLTTLGAWLHLHGAWDSESSPLAAYKHIATMGRDHFVRIVEKGFLYPLGHAAALITETERMVENVPGTSRKAAYLRQRQYIVVREKTRAYPAPEGWPESLRNIARQMPLRSLTLLTERTPNLDPAGDSDISSAGERAFWPSTGRQPFLFHLTAADWEKQRTEFTLPLIFLREDALTDTNLMNAVLVEYHRDQTESWRTARMAGQRVAYGRRVSLPGLKPDEKPGDVAFETQALTLTSHHATGMAVGRPFCPVLEKAQVRLPAVDQLANGPGGATQVIRLHPVWMAHEFSAAKNPGYMLARIDHPPQIQFGGDKVGGLVTPDLTLGGLSFRYGLVGGADTAAFAAGQFDPASFFQDAKIMGGIFLADVVKQVNGFAGSGDHRVPQITSEVRYKENDPQKGPEALRTSVRWTPEVQDTGPFIAWLGADKEAGSGPGSALDLTASVQTPIDPPGEPVFQVDGKLENFMVDIAGCIRLGFPKLRYTAGTGRSPHVDVDLRWVSFEGPLAFVGRLQDAIGGLTGDLFSVDVQPTGIRAAFSLPLPDVAVGVFSLQNLKVSAALSLPFMGSQPALFRFAFAERQSPFIVTVGPFGGGGFFAITLGLSGVKMLEAALEFGGNIALNLGVASGGVYLMAGIYFAYLDGEGAKLEGYLRCGGHLSVLAIVTVSVEFYMSLAYQEQGNKVWGQASLTVEVEVLFFSKSVSLTVERQFSGDENDPAFSDMVDPAEWDAYAAAFTREVPA